MSRDRYYRPSESNGRRPPPNGRSTTFRREGGGGGDRWQHDMYDNAPSRANRYYQGNPSGPTFPRTRLGDRTIAGRKLMVENLHWNVTERDLKELFSQHQLQDARIVYDSTDRSTGVAELVFESPRDASAAISQYDNVELDGQPMKITKWQGPILGQQGRRDDGRSRRIFGHRGAGGGSAGFGGMARDRHRGGGSSYHPYRNTQRDHYQPDNRRSDTYRPQQQQEPHNRRRTTEETPKKSQSELDTELQAYISSAPPKAEVTTTATTDDASMAS